MIDRFQIRNFKSLDEVSISPQRVNLLIGPNGSGKSSLLHAIYALKAFASPTAFEFFNELNADARDIPNIANSSKSVEWAVDATLPPTETFNGGTFKYRSSLVISKATLIMGNEELRFSDGNREIPLITRSDQQVLLYDRKRAKPLEFNFPRVPVGLLQVFSTYPEKERVREIKVFRDWLDSFRYFSIFDPKALRNRDRGVHKLIGSSGEHLAPVLANFKRRHPENFAKLVTRMKRVFPQLHDISFSGRGWGWQSIRLHERRNAREIVLNNRQISDGVLRLIAITSFLYLDDIPSVIMFEEPENGVHPHLLREMVQVLKEITLRKRPNRVQLFFTSHSPHVLDEFLDHPEQVWLVNKADAGSTKVVQLSEKKQLEKIKKNCESLGDAWYFDNVGANPSPYQLPE
jgi:predicted ATPase